MNYTFELEYDGVYYEIEAEYGVQRDRQDHAFGCRMLESLVPAKWVAYVDGAALSITDAELKRAIWRECDVNADIAYYYGN